MKRTFIALLGCTMMLIANPCFSATNQSKLIRNPEMKNDMLVSETIFKMEGSSLVKYMKHNYKYDDQKQRTEDESLKWNPTGERWENDLCIRYTYTEKTITTEYYKWNKKKKDYVLVPEMTITMDK